MMKCASIISLVIVLSIRRNNAERSTSVFSIELNEFSNPFGYRVLENRHRPTLLCCDGFPRPLDGKCVDACDTRLDICLDDINSTSNSIEHCPFGSATTGMIVSNKNSFKFPKPFAGMASNPVTFRFRSWPGSIRVKMFVTDVDEDFREKIDTFSFVYQSHYLRSAEDTYSIPIGLSGNRKFRPTTLSISTRSYCLPGHFGARCEVSCFDRNDCSGHYTCNDFTGDKECLPGWTGPDCIDRISGYGRSACPGNNTCGVGGTCVFVGPQAFNYYCCCNQGFAGIDCSRTVSACVDQPCQNRGTCAASNADERGYGCQCRADFYGRNCELSRFALSCVDKPCMHGGECRDLLDTNLGFQCDCPRGYSGTVCERKRGNIEV